jgi:hypothetical protein
MRSVLEAEPGELVVAAVRRQGRGWTWSNVAHVCEVDHRYGPDRRHRWVRPLCGSEAGRGGEESVMPVCRRCAVVARRRRIEVGR